MVDKMREEAADLAQEVEGISLNIDTKQKRSNWIRKVSMIKWLIAERKVFNDHLKNSFFKTISNCTKGLKGFLSSRLWRPRKQTIPFHIFILLNPPLIKASFNTWYDYHVGNQIKIKLICTLTKDRDQPLISISTIQEFSALWISFFLNLKYFWKDEDNPRRSV